MKMPPRQTHAYEQLLSHYRQRGFELAAMFQGLVGGGMRRYEALVVVAVSAGAHAHGLVLSALRKD